MFQRVIGSIGFEFRFQAFVHRELDLVADSCKFSKRVVLVALFEFTNEYVAFLRVPVGTQVSLRGHSKDVGSIPAQLPAKLMDAISDSRQCDRWSWLCKMNEIGRRTTSKRN